MNILLLFFVIFPIKPVKDLDLPNYTVYIAIDDSYPSKIAHSELSRKDWLQFAKHEDDKYFIAKMQLLHIKITRRWTFKFVDKYDLEYPSDLDYFPAYKVGKSDEWVCFPDIATKQTGNATEYMMYEYYLWYLPFREANNADINEFEEYDIIFDDNYRYRPHWKLSREAVKQRTKIKNLRKSWYYANWKRKIKKSILEFLGQ